MARRGDRSGGLAWRVRRREREGREGGRDEGGAATLHDEWTPKITVD